MAQLEVLGSGVEYRCPYCSFTSHSMMAVKKHVCRYHLHRCPECGVYFRHLGAHVFKKAVEEDRKPGPHPHMVIWFFLPNHNHRIKTWDRAMFEQRCKVHAVQACIRGRIK